MDKWIAHVDMDAFFAAVEQLDHPEMRGRPVIIGGGDRGVVSTCSYEARAYGVRSAMPIFRARKLCPQAIFVHGRYKRYTEMSAMVMRVLARYSPVMEQASVDEAYLDVSGTERIFGPLEKLVRSLKDDVRRETGLTCSVGVAPVKFLAKICSDINKPDGFYILQREAVAAFLRELPVRKIPGVGGKAQERLANHGIGTAGDVQRYSRDFFERNFGKWGLALFERAHGKDDREVTPYTAPKSESAENTFSRDTRDKEELRDWLLLQAERVAKGLRKYGVEGRTVTLRIKFSDFRSITRSRTLSEPTRAVRTIFETASALLEAEELSLPVRLIGVGVSNFDTTTRQFSLIPEAGEDKERLLDETLEQVRERFGSKAIVRGRLFNFSPKHEGPAEKE